MGFELDGDTRVGRLRTADQQKVEILRALSRDAGLIVMDEPTAALSRPDVIRLHETIRRLAGSGTTIVLVSHLLREVLDLAQEVTILRDGRVVRTAQAADETEQSLLNAMLGRSLGATFPAKRPAGTTAPVVLSVAGLTAAGVNGVSLDVRAGEIVGLAGLVGAGRTELARALASLVTGGNLIILYSHPSFGDLARTSFLSVNTSTWLMVVTVVLLAVVLARTTAGRYMYAAGGNAEAARLAGVRVQLIKVATFVISGGAAALGGLIDTSRVLSAQASNGETALTFTVLAGIVVGGTSILGGEGGIWRTVVGVLFIALIGNGFDLLGLNPLYEQITLGAILLIAVGTDAWSRLRTA